MDCTTIQDKLSQYIDNSCNQEDNKLIQEHLERCSNCKEEYILLKSIVDEVNDIEEVDLPIDFHKNLMIKLENEVEKERPTKKLFSNVKMIYTSVAAAFILILVFSVVNNQTINNYEQQGNGELFDSYGNNEEQVEGARTLKSSNDGKEIAPYSIAVEDSNSNNELVKDKKAAIQNDVAGEIKQVEEDNKALVSNSKDTNTKDKGKKVESNNKGIYIFFAIILLIGYIIIKRMKNFRR
jgi:hypothetical protein